MILFNTKINPLPGSKYSEVYPRAYLIYGQIASLTKRHPYVRSAYFGGQKVFLEYFWSDLWMKNWRDRVRRLKYYPCAIDLLKYSRINPNIIENPNKQSEIFYRFIGMTRNGQKFAVQVKENRKKLRKYFMSVFPID